ncbi:hypothetical protein [Halomonas sp. BM-2019]|uniref:hypothetical protein n=1 Tax=Halomonas sp. BM-2019 TaxID=2811227 RepID=UPI001B3C2741|nr:MAG: hypothetical protein J5F18_19355 [Halomonas sp. BM-2019]
MIHKNDLASAHPGISSLDHAIGTSPLHASLPSGFSPRYINDVKVVGEQGKSSTWVAIARLDGRGQLSWFRVPADSPLYRWATRS